MLAPSACGPCGAHHELMPKIETTSCCWPVARAEIEKLEQAVSNSRTIKSDRASPHPKVSSAFRLLRETRLPIGKASQCKNVVMLPKLSKTLRHQLRVLNVGSKQPFAHQHLKAAAADGPHISWLAEVCRAQCDLDGSVRCSAVYQAMCSMLS